MPLLHTLKGCIEKNNFQWTNEAEKALQKIKEALHELPNLATPIPRETLHVYLSTSGEAISSVLAVEREGEQRPVYFVSRVLQGPELNYPMLAKLVLALTYAARRLRRYFQAHQIEVLMSYPIKQILLTPETSGRLAKWAIELGEHDINYRPRTSIKGQALADFLLEIPDGGNPAKGKVWVVEGAPADHGSSTLYTDGASSREGLGAGMILTSPEGEEIPISENKRADALSKLASTCFDHLSKKVLVEVLRERSIDEQQVNTLTPAGTTWMTPFQEYLQRGVLSDDHDEARKIRINASSYAIVNGELYKKRFTYPWLKCADQAKGEDILQEAHSGQVGADEGARALTGKVLRMGVYWPTIQQDAIEVTRKCGECQSYAPVQANPLAPLSNISSPWPFYRWGIDIVGPFPEAPRKLKYMVVAVDYITKWIEAEPLAFISGRHMIKFVWKNIMTRFVTPKVLIGNNGLQFVENPFREWCTAKGISQRFTSVAHPQANGQTEVSNRTIVNGIKKRLGKAKGN
ncbi:uncharacterized protein LOC111917544 [Lactuca sativa]|uniref:uncharacterized protein LOC111917544 n=1 Tax=Lactuca sativa TaxID=4236 RepID=UPI000CD97D29|nr:uncharacterized protein LOC111917544 [Lactuca sativa]